MRLKSGNSWPDPFLFEGETLSTAIYDESKRVYVLEFEDKKLVA